MLSLNVRTTDLRTWLGRARVFALRLFFSGGVIMGVLGVFAPQMGGADPAWGQALLAVATVLSVLMVGLAWRFAARVSQGHWDGWFMVIGNVCVTLAMLGESLRFDSQWSALVIFWPMALVAGLMERHWLWPQVGGSVLTAAVMGWAGALWMNSGPLWPLKIVMVAIPVVFTGLVISFFRTVALQEAQELRRLGRTDPLTGLLNRRALFDGFPGWLAEVVVRDTDTRVPALVMLDLDHFKQVNDRLGHAAGDEVLQQFASALRAEAQEGDLLVRMGGEEFVWLTAAPSATEVVQRVERLRMEFGEMMQAQGVTVSAGVACWPVTEDGTAGLEQAGALQGLDAVLKAADTALYSAKEAGRNRTIQFIAA